MPTYNHNDYYGYINKIEEKAISNPKWYWSQNDDASQARQWISQNAPEIHLEIYRNTPDDMKMKISSKMLPKELREERVINKQRENTNKIAKNIAEAGAVIAGAPATLSGFAIAPVTTGLSLINGALSGAIGSLAGKEVGKHIYTRGVEPNGLGASISTNQQSGAELGGLTGSLIGGTIGGLYGNTWETPLKKKYSWYRPADTFTSAEREAARNEINSYLDNIQKWEDRIKWVDDDGTSVFFNPVTRDLEINDKNIQLEGVDPRITFSKDVMLPSYRQSNLFKYGKFAKRINTAIDTAENALKYTDQQYGKNDNLWIRLDDNRDLEFSESPIYSKKQNQNSQLPKSRDLFDPNTLKQWMEFSKMQNDLNSPEEITIGTLNLPDDFVIYDLNGGIHRFDTVMGHEIGHTNPLFKTLEPYGLKKEDSPLYGFDYSKVSPKVKSLLAPDPKRALDLHSKELTEWYADARGIDLSMYLNGIKRNGKNKYSPLQVLKYRYLVPGARENRFFLQHPGLIRQTKALNAITNTE